MEEGDGPDLSLAGDGDEVESPELAAARSELATLRAKQEETESKLLRTAADFQNFVRRSGLNIDEAKQEAYMKVAKSLVGVLDNFDRAMENFDPETASAADVLEGVDSTRAALIQAWARLAWRKSKWPPATPSTPTCTKPSCSSPRKTVESGCVSQQFLPGYTLNDFPVRAAQVSVAQ